MQNPRGISELPKPLAKILLLSRKIPQISVRILFSEISRTLYPVSEIPWRISPKPFGLSTLSKSGESDVVFADFITVDLPPKNYLIIYISLAPSLAKHSSTTLVSLIEKVWQDFLESKKCCYDFCIMQSAKFVGGQPIIIWYICR